MGALGSGLRGIWSPEGKEVVLGDQGWLQGALVMPPLEQCNVVLERRAPPQPTISLSRMSLQSWQDHISPLPPKPSSGRTSIGIKPPSPPLGAQSSSTLC